MSKRQSGKPAAGQRGLTEEFANVQRQMRIGFQETSQTQAKVQYKSFVPGPNPNLGRFAAAHTRTVDEWAPAAFDKDLVGQKTSSLYTFHTYWSKKDPSLISQYVLHYTRPGELIVDPFAGSGTTGLAALLSGRSVVLVDASPSATLLSHFCCLPGSPEDVVAALERLLAKAGPEVDGLYATKCDRCGGPAVTEYVIWSDRFQCPKCAEYIPLLDCPEEKVELPTPGRTGKSQLKKKRVCPLCLARNDGQAHRDFVISTRRGKASAVPVLVRYKCSQCRPAIGERRHNEDKRTRKAKYFEEVDLAKLSEIENQRIPYWYPERKMMDVADDTRPWGVKWRAGTSNFRSIAELYTKRNLWALAALRHALVLQRHVGQLSMVQVIIFQELKSFLRISIRTWLMDQNPCETSHFLAIGVLTQRCSTRRHRSGPIRDTAFYWASSQVFTLDGLRRRSGWACQDGDVLHRSPSNGVPTDKVPSGGAFRPQTSL